MVSIQRVRSREWRIAKLKKKKRNISEIPLGMERDPLVQGPSEAPLQAIWKKIIDSLFKKHKKNRDM